MDFTKRARQFLKRKRVHLTVCGLSVSVALVCVGSSNYRRSKIIYNGTHQKCNTDALLKIVNNNPNQFKELKLIKNKTGSKKTEFVTRDTKGLIKLIRQAARRRTSAQYELASYLLYDAQLSAKFHKMVIPHLCLQDTEKLEDRCLSNVDSQTVVAQSFCLASQAAYKKHAEAQFLLCQMYDRGVGTEKDYATAVQWCKESFRNGYNEAGTFVASFYADGNGVKRDKNLAFTWLQEAANRGHKRAQMILIRECAARNSNYCDKNVDIVAYWLSKLVKDTQLSPDLSLLMGMVYAFGWGGATIDYKTTLRWFQTIQSRGFIDQGAANFNLAFMYTSKWIDFNAEKATLHFTNYIITQLDSGDSRVIISSHISKDSMRTEYQHVAALYIKTLETTARRIVEAKNRLIKSSKNNNNVSDYALSHELGYTGSIDSLLDVNRVKQKLYSAAEAFRWGQCTWAENFCVAEDKARAEKLYRMAAQLEHHEAKQLIASLKGTNLADKDLNDAAQQLCVGYGLMGPMSPYVRSQIDNVQHMDATEIYQLYKSPTGSEPRTLSDPQIFKMCNKFARLGHVESQIKLILFLSSRFSTDEAIPKDNRKALKWAQSAWKNGSYEAGFLLGEIYADGGYGVPVDKKKAVQWWEMAWAKMKSETFKNGHPIKLRPTYLSRIAYLLGEAYNDGLGVLTNYKKAYQWYLEAAQRGSFLAQYYLADFYLEGKGIKTNEVHAYAWLNIAASCSPKECTEKQRKIIKEKRDGIYLWPKDNLNKAQALSEQLLDTSSEDSSQSGTN